MKSTLIPITVALGLALSSGQAAAWASANRFGGSTEHVPGATEHTNAAGGSSAHAYGEGTEHTNRYGGSTAHAWDGGTEHTTAGGATAYRAPYPAAPVYAPYHPPVAVPAYGAGCYNCAGAAAAGAVVGVAAGAAIASANKAAATSSAYASGYAAGSAAPAPAYNAAPATAYVMGGNYAKLPAGAMAVPKNGVTYYLSGNTWFQPAYGANGVYYRVVPTP